MSLKPSGAKFDPKMLMIALAEIGTVGNRFPAAGLMLGHSSNVDHMAQNR